MKLLSSCLGVLAWLVGLVVVGYLVVNLFAVGRGVVERRALAGDVTELLAEQVPVASGELEQLESQVGRPADHQWVEQACERTSDDQGWFPYTYRERCDLNAVGLWRVGSRREAAQLAQVGTAEAPGQLEGCSRLGETSDGAEATYVVMEGEQPWCLGGTIVDRRAVAGERVAPGAGAWLLVVKGSPLVDEAIGCARWSVIFCDDPWGEDRHAWGKPPA